MLPSSRWALRLSRSSRQTGRYLSTKQSGVPRKVVRRYEANSHIKSTPQSRDAPDLSASAAQRHIGQASAEQNVRSSGSDAKDHAKSTSEVENVLQETAEEGRNDLLAPVNIPHDPYSILHKSHPAMSILANSSVVIQRNLELMQLMVGFQQANKYIIMDATGNHIGYLAEPNGNMLKRQAFKTHRPFTVHVFDKEEKEVLRISRPFTWLNSKITVYDAVNPDPNAQHEASEVLANVSAGSVGSQTSAQLSSLRTEEMRVIGEVQQQWAPLRRKYNLFLNRPPHEQRVAAGHQITAGDLPLSDSTALQRIDPNGSNVSMAQWAYCDEPFLSWDFALRSEDERLVGSVNRNFAGFGRELFTDTGVYALRFDAAAMAQDPSNVLQQDDKISITRPLSETGMTLDQRAIMLATAISIDFDYFSRHSGGGMFPMPLWIPWGGGAAAEGAGAGAAGAAGAEAAGGVAVGEAAAGGIAGTAARGVGGYSTEGAMAGAGTMAGYDAMQRGMGGDGSPTADDTSPTAHDPWSPQSPGADGGQQPPTGSGGEDFWGENSSPWDSGPSSGGDSNMPIGGGGGGGEGGGGVTDWLSDFFDS